MRRAPWLGIAFVLVVPTTVRAQTPVFDHLQCFRIAASGIGLTRTADLNPEQTPPFSLAAGCKIRPKPKLLCIDVAKQNLQPPVSTLPINGDTARDYLCYDVKCPPGSGVSDDLFTDQFGEHRVTTKPTRHLCVPAIRGPAPRPTAVPCNDLGGGQCSDTCSGNYRCLFVPSGFNLVGSPIFPIDIIGMDDCRCVPPETGCTTAPASICATAGDELFCPSSGEHCVSSSGGCACQ